MAQDNTKAYEAKSDVAEARQDAAEGKSKYSVGVYDKITADNWEHKGHATAILMHDEGHAISICPPSPWGLMIISP